MREILPIYLAVFFAAVVFGIIVPTPANAAEYRWAELDFDPQPLGCTGQPNLLTFTPSMRLNENPFRVGWNDAESHGNFRVWVNVVEKKKFLGIDWLRYDHKIGEFSALFRPYEETPYGYQVGGQNSEGFVLGCTEQCKVRSNLHAAAGSSAEVYLEIQEESNNVWEEGQANPIGIANSKSPSHRLHCGSTTRPAPVCAVRADCAGGLWCIQGECKLPVLGGLCSPKRGCGESAACRAVKNDPTVASGIQHLGPCEPPHTNVPGAECRCVQF